MGIFHIISQSHHTADTKHESLGERGDDVLWGSHQIFEAHTQTVKVG